ncbi:hypothetical protein LN42_04195 [Marinitoga sp. 1137]|uniref:TetR/AcrR family transcriptional regulator n=1 Tax=Marinitoga sp. 1137 TaxID=1545835 RepID=UPI0009506819|nr:TetR/AcrR family transcriptional regulator [Marinitoga sp. 1137]APT75674.1 hypothetical protein LN42_04195 [Marinitoga sp. 1137]
MPRRNLSEEEIQRKKRIIMNEAKKLFFEKGFENTSMSEIAKASKMAKGTIYLYFSNKKDLYFSLVYEGLEILEKLIISYIQKEKNALNKILSMGRAYIQFYREYPDYYSFVIKYESEKADLDPEEPKVVSTYEKSEKIYDILKLLILKGLEDGSIRKDIDKDKLAALLWLQTIGIVQQYELRKKLYENWNEFVAESILDFYIDFMKKTLEPRD